MSDSYYVLKCKNHPNLRWTARRIVPGMISHNTHLTFQGELPSEERPTGRPAYPFGGPGPFGLFKSRFEGYNPYGGPNMKDPDGPSITKWAHIVEFVEYIQSVEKKFSFECECPFADLEEVPEETTEYIYETITLPEREASK